MVDLPSCAISSAPFHPECDLLQRAMNWTERVPARMNKIIIRRNIKDEEDRAIKWPGVTSDEIELPCYAETGNSGWCGTCLTAAKVRTFIIFSEAVCCLFISERAYS